MTTKLDVLGGVPYHAGELCTLVLVLMPDFDAYIGAADHNNYGSETSPII